MFLTDKLMAARREASREVAEGKVYSVELPIVGRVPVPSPGSSPSTRPWGAWPRSN